MQIFTGFHAVEEKLLSLKKDEIKNAQIFFCKPGPRVKKILRTAETLGVFCSSSSKEKLNLLAENLSPAAREHRGILLLAKGEIQKSNLIDFEFWLSEFSAKKNAEAEATVLILDSITDPHNVGAILRSADQFAVSLVVVPARRALGKIDENEIVARASAGAASWVKVSVVQNLSRTTRALKDAGFWIYGADAKGEAVQKCDFAKKRALVLGSEGAGISHALSKECDALVSIPTCGKIDSLNVSVAAGILLYEMCRQNLSK